MKNCEHIKEHGCIKDICTCNNKPRTTLDKILEDILSHQQEIISNPIRFNGVHVEKIKEVFRKYGIDESINF